jgi:hypothetical protein
MPRVVALGEKPFAAPTEPKWRRLPVCKLMQARAQCRLLFKKSKKLAQRYFLQDNCGKMIKSF